MKRLFLLDCIFCFLVAPLVMAIPPQEGLVLWFAFDEDSGTSILDLSENGNNGTVDGEARWVNEGKYGGGMEFDGGEVTIPISDSLTFGNSITVTVWVRGIGAKEAFYPIVGKGHIKEGTYLLAVDNNWRDMALTWTVVNSEWERFDVAVEGLFAPGQWQFMAGIYNGESAMLYLDGHLKKKIDAKGKIDGRQNLIIGGQGGGGRRFKGTLDEVRIYNRILDEAEIGNCMRDPDIAIESENKLAGTWGMVKN